MPRLTPLPGIAAVMRKHNWTVGLLSEMPPEGKVGVSPVCILGEYAADARSCLQQWLHPPAGNGTLGPHSTPGLHHVTILDPT